MTDRNGRGFFRPEVDKELQNPLRSIASARGIKISELTSQIIRRFVLARQELLLGLAKNNEKEATEK